MAYGPTFGYANGKYDIHIDGNPLTSRVSSTDPGHSYQLPAGYSPETVKSRSLLACSPYRFRPTNIEVFWGNLS